jgi:energy-coupling factor transporter transmembrane protein EcfT
VKRGPHPEARFAAWLAVVVGSFLTSDVGLLLTAWSVILVLLARCGQLRNHFRLVFAVLLPLGLILALVWGTIVGAPPDLPRGSAPYLGYLHAARVVARLGVIAGISQAAFLTISPNSLWPTARRLRIGGTPLAIVLSSFALAANMTKVVDQTLTALKARGAISPNRYWTRVVVLPAMFSNLWNRLIADQIQRVEYKWAPQGTLSRVCEIAVEESWSTKWSTVVVCGGLCWLALAAWSVVHG